VREPNRDRRDGKILKPPAVSAQEVVVRPRVGVEMQLSPRDMDLLENLQITEERERRIDRRPTRHREVAYQRRAEPRRGPVAALFGEVADNRAALGGEGEAVRPQPPLDLCDSVSHPRLSPAHHTRSLAARAESCAWAKRRHEDRLNAEVSPVDKEGTRGASAKR